MRRTGSVSCPRPAPDRSAAEPRPAPCSGPPSPDPDPHWSVMSTPSPAALGRGSQSSPAGRGFLFVVLAALCWGTSGVGGQVVLDRTDLGPLDIAWHRMAVAAVVLLAGQGLTGRRRPGTRAALPRGTAVRLLLVGAGLGGYQLAFFAAVSTAGVSIATLVALGLAPLL